VALRRIPNQVLQQVHPGQSWESGFFCGVGSANDREANMIDER